MLKHFLPPVAVNALLGTVLWTSYGHVYSYLEPSCGNHTALAAAISGGVAGGCQALVAAPAENVRLFLEGGSGGISWSHAWKEVFRNQIISQNHQREEIRQVRSWMRDVGEMAGRGWNGWRWGCCKDICGFAAFFSIFEITRQASAMVRASTFTDTLLAKSEQTRKRSKRILNGVILVTGGVFAGLIYECVCRPWDRARHIVHLAIIEDPRRGWLDLAKHLGQSVKQDGIRIFVNKPSHEDIHPSTSKPRFYKILRVLGRVGPWGVGFLVWETYGPGLS